MSDQNASVLDFLREQFARLHGKIDGLREDIVEVKHRLTAVELGLAAVRREVAVLAEADAHLNAGMDRLGERILRIERRLDIVDA